MSNELLELIEMSLLDSKDKQIDEIGRTEDAIDYADLVGPYKSATSPGTSDRWHRSSFSSNRYNGTATDIVGEEEWSGLHNTEKPRPTRQFSRLPRYGNEGNTHTYRTHTLPKSLSYDGTTSWKAFQLKFNKYAEAQH